LDIFSYQTDFSPQENKERAKKNSHLSNTKVKKQYIVRDQNKPKSKKKKRQFVLDLTASFGFM